MADAAKEQPIPEFQAIGLLRAARVGTLATVIDGQPFASLVTPATAPDRSVLLWLSDLSEHTRHLNTDPRCSILVSGPAESANPQTAPRLTITGLAEPSADRSLKARWLAVHPYAALYADFADFRLWRIAPRAGLLVGGFARATRLRQTAFAADPPAVAAVGAAADGIIAHCNADHADALALLAGTPGPWRMVVVDVDGCDLAQGEVTRRIAWSAPAADAASVRTELVRLIRAIRAA